MSLVTYMGRSSERLFYWWLSVCMLAVLGSTVPLHAQWQRSSGLATGEGNDFVTSITGSSTRLVCGTHAGVHTSSDHGLTWQAELTGYPIDSTGGGPVRVTDVAVTSTGDIYCGTNRYGVLVFRNGTWTPIKGLPDGCTAMKLLAVGDTVYLGLFRFGLWSTVTGTDTADIAIAPAFDSILTVTSLTTLADGGILCGTRHEGFLYRAKGEQGWLPMNYGLPRKPITGGVASANDAGWIAATALAFNELAGGIYLHDPAKADWTLAQEGIPIPFATLFSVASARSTFFISTGYFSGLGIYTRTPDEAEWHEWNEGLTDKEVEAIHVEPRGGDIYRIHVGTRSTGTWWRDTVVSRTTVGVDDDVQAGESLAGRKAMIVDLLGNVVGIVDGQLSIGGLPKGWYMLVPVGPGKVRRLIID